MLVRYILDILNAADIPRMIQCLMKFGQLNDSSLLRMRLKMTGNDSIFTSARNISTALMMALRSAITSQVLRDEGPLAIECVRGKHSRLASVTSDSQSKLSGYRSQSRDWVTASQNDSEDKET